MKLSKVLEELLKGNSIKFSKGSRAIFQIQRIDVNEVIIFDRFGNRNIYSLKKKINILSKYVTLDKKGLKELNYNSSDIKEILKYSFDKKSFDIKIFKRPVRKSAGAKPINDALESHFNNNLLSFMPEFKTYRIRIRSIADYISVEENQIVVYEVKSDVDSFIRLEKQVKDYLTYADKVYIVLHEKKVKSFLNGYSHLLEKCGLIIFNEELRFESQAPINNPKRKTKLLLSKEEMSVLKQFKGYTKVKDKASFFKKVFSQDERDRIICNILSDRFEKRRNKIYTEGALSLDLEYSLDKFNKFMSSIN